MATPMDYDKPLDDIIKADKKSGKGKKQGAAKKIKKSGQKIAGKVATKQLGQTKGRIRNNLKKTKVGATKAARADAALARRGIGKASGKGAKKKKTDSLFSGTQPGVRRKATPKKATPDAKKSAKKSAKGPAKAKVSIKQPKPVQKGGAKAKASGKGSAAKKKAPVITPAALKISVVNNRALVGNKQKKGQGQQKIAKAVNKVLAQKVANAKAGKKKVAVGGAKKKSIGGGGGARRRGGAAAKLRNAARKQR